LFFNFYSFFIACTFCTTKCDQYNFLSYWVSESPFMLSSKRADCVRNSLKNTNLLLDLHFLQKSDESNLKISSISIVFTKCKTMSSSLLHIAHFFTFHGKWKKWKKWHIHKWVEWWHHRCVASNLWQHTFDSTIARYSKPPQRCKPRWSDSRQEKFRQKITRLLLLYLFFKNYKR
jgi:hypothetical protein